MATMVSIETLSHLKVSYWFYYSGGEVEPVEYIIKPSEGAIDGCKAITGDYNLCPVTSVLLDSAHGPKNFSHAALNRFYTQLTNSERTLFKFSSKVHLDVVQVYYYAEPLGEHSSRVILTFYSIENDRYVPRRNIPSDAKQLGFISTLNISRTFNSLCFTLASDVKNLLLASTFVGTDLHVSEINFFTGQVSDEICKGEYPVFPTEGKKLSEILVIRPPNFIQWWSGWSGLLDHFVKIESAQPNFWENPVLNQTTETLPLCFW